MPLCFYELSKEQPAKFASMILPSRQVYVCVNDEICCSTVVQGDGRVEMDLPQDFIDGVNKGTHIVEFRTNDVPSSDPSGKTEQLFKIETIEKH